MRLTGTILKLEYTHYSADNKHLNDMMVIPLQTNATGMMIMIYFMLFSDFLHIFSYVSSITMTLVS